MKITERKMARWALALALALPPALSLRAADASDDVVSRAEFNGLRADLQTLRDDWARRNERNTPSTLRGLAISGTLQTRYTFREDQDPAKPNFFSVPSALLNFKGSLYKDYAGGNNLDYSLGLTSGTNNAAFALTDANLTYAILSASDPEAARLSVTFGQQNKIFGTEPTTTEDKRPTINQSAWVTNLGVGGRDNGLVVKGDFFPHNDYGYSYRVAPIEYGFGVFNGNGVNASDTNQDKDLAARINFNAPVDYNSFFRGLNLGFSGLQGYKQGANTGTGINRITADLNSRRYGFDLGYANVPIGITLEGAQGEEETLTGSTLANTRQFTTISRGGTLTIFYEFGNQFIKSFTNQTRADDWWPTTYQLFVRADAFDPDINVDNNATGTGTLGFNLFFAQTTKLQINYSAVQSEIKPLVGDQYLFQFQYGF